MIEKKNGRLQTQMPDDLWTKLKSCTKPIVLFGTGNGADKILNRLIDEGITVEAIFASDGFVRNRTFRGYTVESYDDIKKRLGEMVILMCFGSSRTDVRENVLRLMKENEFYLPDVPVYGSNVFNQSYYEAHLSEINRVRDILADEVSRKTFDGVINYKISGDLRYVFECETNFDEREKLLNHESKSEVLIDLGAYNGDTVSAYRTLVPSISEVIAVEPDKRNFRKLAEKFSSDVSVKPINALISDSDGMATLQSKRGRGVHDSDVTSLGSVNGSESLGEPIEKLTVDSLLSSFFEKGGEKNLLIKVDVEGNEAKMIDGAKRIISNACPDMVISCYHRSEDIFELPLKILELSEQYEVFLRHAPSIPAWDTEFIFIRK